jgi:hypothetical protein
MNPDVIVGVILLVFGAGFSIWAVLTRAGGVTVFVGLATAFMGLGAIMPSLIPAGPVKTATLAFFLAVSIAMLIVAVIKNRRAAHDQRV